MSTYHFSFLRSALKFRDQLKRLRDEERDLSVPCTLRQIYTLFGRKLARSQLSLDDRDPTDRCSCKTLSRERDKTSIVPSSNHVDLDKPKVNRPNYVVPPSLPSQKPMESMRSRSTIDCQTKVGGPFQHTRNYDQAGPRSRRSKCVANLPDVETFRKAVSVIENSKGPVFIDIQWLRSYKGVVLKEFAATGDGTPTAWILVRPPEDDVPVSRDNRYVTEQVHGIPWDAGYVDEHTLKVLVRGLFKNARQVYCKGEEKLNVLVEKLGVSRLQVATLDRLPKLSDIQNLYGNATPACPFHRSLNWTLSCSMKRSKAMSIHHTHW